MDSDGYITIRRHSCNGKYPDSDTFSELVGVGQTQPEAVELFVGLWKGSVQVRKRKTEGNWKPMYCWTVTNKLAAACIHDLRPFLRLKADQADLVLALRASKDRPRSEVRTVKINPQHPELDPMVYASRVDLWNQVRALNDRRERIKTPAYRLTPDL